MLREILIVITFKEFDGSRSAEIQEYWLNHLHNQTNKNFRLIVTNFREKNVKKALEKAKVPFEYFQSSTDCIYSLSDMLENTLKFIEPGKQIIFFPSADHIFDDNLFEVIANTFQPNTGGTSFPHPQHLTIDDYQNNVMYDEYHDEYRTDIFEYDPNKHIPETFYLDADLFLEKKWQTNFFKQKFVGTVPGISFHLLMLTSARTLDNLIFQSRVHKIISHVDPSTNKLDMINHLSESHKTPWDWQRNGDLVMQFCQLHGIKKKIYEGTIFRGRKLVMFSRFKPVGTAFEKLTYYAFLLKFSVFPVGELFVTTKIKSIFRKFFMKVRQCHQ